MRSNSIFFSTVVSSGSHTIIIIIIMYRYIIRTLCVCIGVYIHVFALLCMFDQNWTWHNTSGPRLHHRWKKKTSFLYHGNTPPSYYVPNNILLDLPDQINKQRSWCILFRLNVAVLSFCSNRKWHIYNIKYNLLFLWVHTEKSRNIYLCQILHR